MNSIRTRLLLAVLAALVLLLALVGTVSYRSVLREAAALFDYHLRQTALSLRDQGEISDEDAAVLSDEQLDMVVQIWRIDGHTVYANRAHRALPGHAVLGYAEIDVQGERWRSFGVAAGGRVIQVAQPMRIRQSLATDAALRSVLPLLGAAPVLGVALWALIAYTMRPLERVAAELRDRDAGALAPLAVHGLPDEVAPLVRALNGLLQRLEQAFELQRGFVADAAHELRSPLTALKLQAQLVRRAGDDTTRAQALEALVAGVDRAARLTEQLLALARQEPGAALPPLVPTPLAPLLREALVAAQPLAAARGSTLALDLPDGLPPARADAAALAVAVRNLLDNALQYGPPGTHVQVSVEPQGDRLWLHVDDDGPGIPPVERERVQERFVRGSTASAGIDGDAPPTGSGLGLAIVRRVAQRHDAPLRLDDAPLGGLRVSIGLRPAS